MAFFVPVSGDARLRIGHPGGVLEAGVDYSASAGTIVIQSAYGYRTARLLMRGTAYILKMAQVVLGSIAGCILNCHNI
jgi:2-methylaconitate cis-trans-isomerase PrpF